MLDGLGLANHVECLIPDGTKEALTNLTAAFVGVHAAVRREEQTVSLDAITPAPGVTSENGIVR
jgi:hypothetical protein